MVVSESLREVWGNAPWNPNGAFLLMGTRRLVSCAELWTRSDRCYHCSKRHTRDSVPCCVGGTVVWPNTCSWKIQSTNISQTEVLSLESLQPTVGKQDQQSPKQGLNQYTVLQLTGTTPFTKGILPSCHYEMKEQRKDTLLQTFKSSAFIVQTFLFASGSALLNRYIVMQNWPLFKNDQVPQPLETENNLATLAHDFPLYN